MICNPIENHKDIILYVCVSIWLFDTIPFVIWRDVFVALKLNFAL